MSLDTTNASPPTDQPSTNGHAQATTPSVDESQWQSLRQRITNRAVKVSAEFVFGESVKGGAVYRWGMAAALGRPCDEQLQRISRMACGKRAGSKRAPLDLKAATDEIIDALNNSRSLPVIDCAKAVAWASALPALTEKLDPQTWWNLLGSLQQLRESVVQRNALDTPAELLIGAELGLTLAWRMSDLPSCKRLEKPSADALAAWCKHDDESIHAAIDGGTQARLVLASLVRCRQILEKTTNRKFKRQQLTVGNELATWVAAMTTHTGRTAFSSGSRADVVDDRSAHGLLGRAIEFDPESLRPALAAALGETQSGGRLAWEVCLPQAFHHSEDAKIAVMFPDWDVRRGRIHLDYSGQDNQIEVFAGRVPVIAGRCQSMIELNGEPQQAMGGWDTTCEYTDDDVHYLEIEQPWTGGMLLQRQWMLVRDDRCVMFADSILPKERWVADSTREIRYRCRLPLAPSIAIDTEPETREVFFADGKRRGLVIPLSASEWRIGQTEATLKSTDDDHLVLSARGTGCLYAPLWFDFQQRRFGRKRTWRQLTVADQLRIVRDDEAVGYRIQVGSEQWLVYRSFGESRCRSVLGKHLIADFFSARFDTGDGSMEELVTVDEQDLIDD